MTRPSERKAVLDEYVSGVLAERVAIEEAHQAREAEAAELSRRREKLQVRGAAAAQRYMAGAQNFEEGVLLLCRGLVAMEAALPDLLKMPDSSLAWSWRGVCVRASKRLGNALAAVSKSGSFGRMKLSATKRSIDGDSFSVAERQMIARFFEHVTNGEVK